MCLVWAGRCSYTRTQHAACLMLPLPSSILIPNLDQQRAGRQTNKWLLCAQMLVVACLQAELVLVVSLTVVVQTELGAA